VQQGQLAGIRDKDTLLKMVPKKGLKKGLKPDGKGN
jgi:hypothetical protein